MRAIVQRVQRAAVRVDEEVVGEIGAGLLVYLAVAGDDGDEDAAYLADKIRHLRIFPDESGRTNLDVQQVGGAVLVVSAFTVLADARHGRRPSFGAAAAPKAGVRGYEAVVGALRKGVPVQTGRYGASMAVESVNAGPITILLDSRRQF